MDARLRITLVLSAACAYLPAQWSLATPGAAPGVRIGHAMAADTLGFVVQFGGDRGVFPNPYNNETWVFDGVAWTQLPTATAPSPRTEAQLVYDVLRGRYVLFGGWTSSISIGSGNSETWEFDGVSWTQMAPTTSPPGVWKHGAAYDLVRGRTVIYGGATSGLPGAVATTWEYDGVTWQQRTPTGSPGPRENHAMCFHLASGRTVMFGGVHPTNGVVDQTWTYDGTTWAQVPIVGSWPPARTGAAMTYDAARGVCVMTGGMTGTGVRFDDTWEFDGTSWTQQNTTMPGGRDLAIAWSAMLAKTVRYGGHLNPGETWCYGASTRSFGAGCAGSFGVPGLSPQALPLIGQTYSLQLDNLVPAVGVGILVLSLTEIAPTPLDAIGMPGCAAFVTPDLLVTVPATGGVAVWSAPLPAQSSLLGTGLFAQGLSLDPGWNPAWLVASNAIAGVLGH
jgi:hypothetical protein